MCFFAPQIYFVLRKQRPTRRAQSLFAVLLIAAAATFTAPVARAQDKPTPPAPDLLVFTNGDRLTGQLERGVGSAVVFKSDATGEITVPLDKVASLHSSGSFAVLRKNVPVSRGSVVSGTIAYADKILTVATPLGVTQSLPEDQIAYIIDQPTFHREMEKAPGLLYGWRGSINGGATIVRSTDNGSTYTVGVALVRAIPTVPFLPARNRTSFDLQETYGKLTQPVIPQTAPPSPPIIALTSIFHSDAERDEYFSPKYFALARTSFDHNYAQGLNLQDVFGSGIGWTAIKSARQELDVKAEMQYEKQTFQSASSDQNLVGSTFAETYSRTLPHKLVVNESASALPAWNNTSAYSANASLGLVLPVFKRLGLTVSSIDNYLNNPSVGYKKNSFQFITAVAYTLK